LFDRPYEATSSAPQPQPQAAPSAPLRHGMSPNIKAKRKVAALLGGGGG
jgi:hypothetical protein